jgi:hypothetical protein
MEMNKRRTLVEIIVKPTKDISHPNIHLTITIIGSWIKDHGDDLVPILTEGLVAFKGGGADSIQCE